jgi:hypothetical protein
MKRVLNIGGEGEVPGAINVNRLEANLRSIRDIMTASGGLLVQADMAALPFADGMFDEIIGNHLPSLAFPDPTCQSWMDEAYRALARGGHIKVNSRTIGAKGWVPYLEAAGFLHVRVEGGYAVGDK